MCVCYVCGCTRMYICVCFYGIVHVSHKLQISAGTSGVLCRGAGDHEGQGVASYFRAISGVVAGGIPPSPLNFGLWENLFARNFSSKNANFEAEKLLFWGNLGSKLKF